MSTTAEAGMLARRVGNWTGLMVPGATRGPDRFASCLTAEVERSAELIKSARIVAE